LLRALDGLPPRTGALVGTPGDSALLGPCVVIAGDGPLGVVAEACLPSAGGAILAAHDHADPGEVFLEARAYGAIPMVRATPRALERVVGDEPALVVAADAAAADALDLPRLS
jgi:hypothetical protein